MLTDKKLERENDKKKSEELHVWRGNTWYNKKDYTKAIKINPDSEIALYNRGIAWTAITDYPNAINDYDNVIKINPKSASSYLNKASVLRINKKDMCEFIATEEPEDWKSKLYATALQKFCNF